MQLRTGADGKPALAGPLKFIRIKQELKKGLIEPKEQATIRPRRRSSKPVARIGVMSPSLVARYEGWADWLRKEIWRWQKRATM